jgi:hypothetical protein
MDTIDRRPIESMNFGYEAGKDMHELARQTEQEVVTKRVREFLLACGLVVADDINRFGCTGAAACLTGAPHEVVAQIQRLRIDMAGGGVGLPCFVPPTLFCLGHNTIGGLEDGQQAYHTEMVSMISRELTPAEATKVAAMNVARKIKTREGVEEFMAGKSAAEADEPEAVTLEEQGPAVAGPVDATPWRRDRAAVLSWINAAGSAALSRSALLRITKTESTQLEAILVTLREADLITKRAGSAGEMFQITALGEAECRRAEATLWLSPTAPASWKCPEHVTTNWACRHCLAQAVVEGPLEPTFLTGVQLVPGGLVHVSSPLSVLEPHAALVEADKQGAENAALYVRVATFTRKLARD